MLFYFLHFCHEIIFQTCIHIAALVQHEEYQAMQHDTFCEDPNRPLVLQNNSYTLQKTVPEQQAPHTHTHPLILRWILWLSTSRKRWNLTRYHIISFLASPFEINTGLQVSRRQASPQSGQWLTSTHLKFDQANFNASWKFWSSSSSIPLTHRINVLISFSVSFSKVLQ